MKTTNHKGSAIEKGNYNLLKTYADKLKIDPDTIGVLYLIANMMDEIAEGADYYMIIGATQNRSAYSLTIKGTSAPGSIYAANLVDLGQLALDLV